jgi:hypothetical protein
MEPKSPQSQYLADLELHLQQEDAPQILEDIRKLAAIRLYSDNAAYEKNKALKPAVIRCLYGKLDLAKFITITEQNYAASYEIYKALESQAETIPVESLLELIESLGWRFPGAQDAPRLMQKIVATDDEAITRWLQQRIDAVASAERNQGTDFSEHEKTVSAFRYIQWLPDDQGLRETVGILARRQDPLAIQLKEAYLLSLPWGEDRAATMALVTALNDDVSAETLGIIRKGLQKHVRPSPLRLRLLAVLGEHDANEAILTGIDDLRQITDDDARIAYITWLGQAIDEVQQRNLPVNLDKIGQALAGIQTTTWQFLTRGFFGLFMQECPAKPLSGNQSNILERGAVRLVRGFNVCRLDHMGCMVSLPVLLGIGFGLMWGLNHLLRQPDKSLDQVNLVALILWIMAWGGTATTHFSGHETLRKQFVMALIYWGFLALFLATILITRIL